MSDEQRSTRRSARLAAPHSVEEFRERASALTQAFWDCATEGRLVRPVCDRCGHNFFSPTWCCPRCRSEGWSYQDSSGVGVVYSHTTVHRGPDTTWPVPYVLAVVDLNEGWSMLSRLLIEPPTGDDPGSLIGRAVTVSFVREDRPPFRNLPAFALGEVGA